MKTYIGLVSKDADSAYGVFFPDAPGCFSAADHLDDVFPNANEALTNWLALMREQGHPVVKSRDLSELQRDPILKTDWAEADFVIAVSVTSDFDTAEAA